MDNFKQASKLGLRFLTSKGNLTTDQLWQLGQTDLATAVKNQRKVVKKNDEDDLAFLDESTTVDATEQLRFDILKDVYLTKKADSDALKNAKQKKEFNQKILELIQEKKEGELRGKSVEDLTAMLID